MDSSCSPPPIFHVVSQDRHVYTLNALTGEIICASTRPSAEADSWAEMGAIVRLDERYFVVGCRGFSRYVRLLKCDPADPSIPLQQVGILDGHSKLVSHVCSIPSLSLLASGSHDGYIRLYHHASRQPEVPTFTTKAVLSKGSVVGFAQLPEKLPNHLFSAHNTRYSKPLVDWDLVKEIAVGGDRSSNEESCYSTEHTGYIRSLYALPSHGLLATGASDKILKFWSPQGSLVKSTKLFEEALSLVWWPDVNLLAVGERGCLTLWDLRNLDRFVHKVEGRRSYSEMAIVRGTLMSLGSVSGGLRPYTGMALFRVDVPEDPWAKKAWKTEKTQFQAKRYCRSFVLTDDGEKQGQQALVDQDERVRFLESLFETATDQPIFQPTSFLVVVLSENGFSMKIMPYLVNISGHVRNEEG